MTNIAVHDFGINLILTTTLSGINSCLDATIQEIAHSIIIIALKILIIHQPFSNRIMGRLVGFVSVEK